MRRNSRLALISATAIIAAIGLVGCSGTAADDDKDDKATTQNDDKTTDSGSSDSGSSDADTTEETDATDGTEEAEDTKEDSGESDSGTVADGVAGACAQIQVAMEESSTTMSEAMENATDPAAVADLIKSQADAMQKAATDSDNTEVKNALQAVADDYKSFSDLYAGMPDMSDPTALQDPAVMEKLEAFGTDMEAVSTELTESLGELASLCGGKG